VDTGVKISGIAHGVLIGVALFGAPLFSADSEKAIQISEVSLITADEFAAMSSGSVSPAPEKPAEILPTTPPPQSQKPKTSAN